MALLFRNQPPHSYTEMPQGMSYMPGWEPCPWFLHYQDPANGAGDIVVQSCVWEGKDL